MSNYYLECFTRYIWNKESVYKKYMQQDYKYIIYLNWMFIAYITRKHDTQIQYVTLKAVVTMCLEFVFTVEGLYLVRLAK